MKKLLAMMLVIAMSVAMLTGCGSDVEDAGSGTTSEVVSEENTENSEENESVDVSEVNSEAVEEITMYSADEVMAYIDTLIAEYQYNDPEHIKCLVIGANLDYISDDDLNTILTEYGYTLEDLAALYTSENGPLYSAAMSYYNTNNYYLSVADNFAESDLYANKLTLESIMLNSADKEFAKEIDGYLIAGSELDSNSEVKAREIETYVAVTSGEKLVVSYVDYMYGFECAHNPFSDYINTDSQ